MKPWRTAARARSFVKGRMKSLQSRRNQGEIWIPTVDSFRLVNVGTMFIPSLSLLCLPSDLAGSALPRREWKCLLCSKKNPEEISEIRKNVSWSSIRTWPLYLPTFCCKRTSKPAKSAAVNGDTIPKSLPGWFLSTANPRADDFFHGWRYERRRREIRSWNDDEKDEGNIGDYCGLFVGSQLRRLEMLFMAWSPGICWGLIILGLILSVLTWAYYQDKEARLIWDLEAIQIQLMNIWPQTVYPAGTYEIDERWRALNTGRAGEGRSIYIYNIHVYSVHVHMYIYIHVWTHQHRSTLRDIRSYPHVLFFLTRDGVGCWYPRKLKMLWLGTCFSLFNLPVGMAAEASSTPVLMSPGARQFGSKCSKDLGR